jgi:tetratricopeptide (TPR) repeat protein
MTRTARLWKGAGLLTLGGMLLSGVVARGEDGPPLATQLNDLGRQALAQGASAMAQTFFQKALQLDPGNPVATRGLRDSKAAQEQVKRVAFQDPAPGQPPAPATPPPAEPAAAPAPEPGAQPPAATPPAARAPLEESEQADNIARQQLTSDIEQRLQAARSLAVAGQPEAALTNLRLAQNIVRSATNVPESARTALDRRIQAQILSTVRDEERIVSERAERQRLAAAAEQRQRAVSQFQSNQQTIRAMMSQFDLLMGEGVYNSLYNGGMGNISAATAPFYQARILAQQARSLMHKGTLPYSDEDPAPYAGMFVSMTMGFLSQELQFEALKEYRYMLTMQDIARAAVPFPDDQIIEYPDAERWRNLSERRIARYGKAVDVFDRDPKTKQILEKLDQPIAMSFPNETPLEDVLKYIKQATQGVNDSGIPIYVDPLGLTEADRTPTSPVSIDLEGVPLKVTLRLLLKQLGLTYTVKDGFLMITSQDAEDQQTEIRVYPVADLAIIPLSLMGGGGMGGMGMGGMGGGMGGMGMGGGMMGGMGGGMGGMGGGMGMMSVPVVAPQSQDADSPYMEKKSN